MSLLTFCRVMNWTWTLSLKGGGGGGGCDGAHSYRHVSDALPMPVHKD